MSFYDHESDPRNSHEFGTEVLSDAEIARRAYDALVFAREFKYYPSLDPFDYASPRNQYEWERVNQEIDCRIYFGLRLPR